jgi:hypothetical protein
MACTTSSLARWIARFALAGAGLAAGCIIAAGGGDSDECGSLLSHSHVGLNDDCFCDAGYSWEHPDDETDFDCERIPGKGGGAGACTEPYSSHAEGYCYCDDGYKWCDADNPDDYTCCPDDAQDEAGGGSGGIDTDDGAGTADETGADPVEPDPADCTAENEGVSFCSNTDSMGPEGSRYWVCMTGAWVEAPNAADEACIFDGFAFSYGCVDNGSAVEFLCGNGPGTACERDTASCVDGDLLNYCQYGRLTQDSCFRICTEEGDDMGITYDYGLCDAEANDCFCCDSGDTNCPA